MRSGRHRRFALNEDNFLGLDAILNRVQRRTKQEKLEEEERRIEECRRRCSGLVSSIHDDLARFSDGVCRLPAARLPLHSPLARLRELFFFEYILAAPASTHTYTCTYHRRATILSCITTPQAQCTTDNDNYEIIQSYSSNINPATGGLHSTSTSMSGCS